jgi:hypothetical protein
MKQRYSQNFLFPQGAEDYGRSLMFPQGNLRGLGSTTEQANLTYSFLFPQGETEDYGRALMFPQGQLHGVVAASDEAAFRAQAVAWGFDPDDAEQRNFVFVEIEKRKAQKAADDAYDAYIAARNAAYSGAVAKLVYDEAGRVTDASAQAANAFQAQQAAAQEAALIAAESNIQTATQAAQARIIADQQAAAAAAAAQAIAAQAAAAAAAAAATTNAAAVTTAKTIVAVAPPAAKVTNYTYTLDFYNNEFWLKRSDGVAISNGSSDWKSAELFVAPQNIALSSVSVTPAAAAKFAANSGMAPTAGTVATSTGLVSNSVGSTFGQTITTTTNQATGATTVKNTATGVTATTTPATGTTTVVATSHDTGKLALYALLGVLLLRGAVR